MAIDRGEVFRDDDMLRCSESVSEHEQNGEAHGYR